MTLIYATPTPTLMWKIAGCASLIIFATVITPIFGLFCLHYRKHAKDLFVRKRRPKLTTLICITIYLTLTNYIIFSNDFIIFDQSQRPQDYTLNSFLLFIFSFFFFGTTALCLQTIVLRYVIKVILNILYIAN